MFLLRVSGKVGRILMLEHGEWMFPMSVNVDDLIRVRYGVCRVTAVGDSNPEYTLFICVDEFDIEHVIEWKDTEEIEVVFMIEEEVH